MRRYGNWRLMTRRRRSAMGDAPQVTTSIPRWVIWGALGIAGLAIIREVVPKRRVRMV